MRKIKDFFNNNKTLAIAMTAALALTVVGAIIFVSGGDDSDTNETTAIETTTADVQFELTKVDDAIRDEDGNLTTVTVEGKTYDLTTDLKEKIEVDANTTGYIMNDGTTFYEKYSGMVYYETEVTTSPIENDSNVSTNAGETSTTVVADVDSSDSTDSTDSSETETTTVTIADTNTTEAQTTTAKKEESTTKKEEPTTAKKEQQTTAAVVKHESGRLKDCELKLFSQLLDCENLNSNGDWVPALYYDLPYGATEANKFEYVNYRYQALGFDNVHIVSDTGLYDWNRYDDFENSDNLNDEYHDQMVRDFNWSLKFYKAFYAECEAWSSGKATHKYTSAVDFENYLHAKYSMLDTYIKKGQDYLYNKYNDSDIYNCSVTLNSGARIIREDGSEGYPEGYNYKKYNGLAPEWCEKWCYYDNAHQTYRVDFDCVDEYEVRILEKNGYYTDVDAVEYWVMFESGCHYFCKSYVYTRWYYDAKTDKTRIYMVFGN